MQKKEHEGRKEKKLAARLVSFVLPSTTSSRFFFSFQRERRRKKENLRTNARAHTHTHARTQQARHHRHRVLVRQTNNVPFVCHHLSFYYYYYYHQLSQKYTIT